MANITSAFLTMITLACLNCNGLRNNNKRKELFTYCQKRKFDIVCLQETFWNETMHDKAVTEWQGETISSFHPDSLRRGVTCLLRKDSGIEVITASPDSDGRLLQIELSCDDQLFTIISIYAPNVVSERKSFFSNLAEIVKQLENPCIICGDFNNVLNVYLDKYPPVPHHDSSRKPLNNMMRECNLSDIWRMRKPKEISFTRSRTTDIGISASRIDRFLVSHSLTDKVTQCEITKYPRSDHDIIELDFNLTLFPRGHGSWVFNNQLLRDDLFCTAISDLITSSVLEPGYETDLLVWYDQLKEKIKRFSINSSKEKQRAARREKRSLSKQIAYERYKLQKFADYDSTRMIILEDRLNSLQLTELEGAVLRSKLKWIEDGEKSTKFFFGMEKSRQTKKIMKQVFKPNGEIVSDQKNILQEQRNFYTSLYAKESIDGESKATLISNISTRLTDSERDTCEGEMTEDELCRALTSMKNSKSPGPDGLTSEFYKKFWEDLRTIMQKLTVRMFELGDSCVSMKTGLLTLIPKKGDLRHLSNWRPISLLNTDYKIVAKTITNRISNVVSLLVSGDQTCAVPGRDITDNVLIMDHVIKYVNKNDGEGYILKIDQEKAFDRVSHEYLFHVLEHMGFGKNIRTWIELLYANISGRIKHNGFISDPFPIRRGVRQGCPLSAVLYVLSAEPLHDCIQHNVNIDGIPFLDESAKIFQHADDTTLFLGNAQSIDHALKAIELYERGSGSKHNVNKTELLVIGHGSLGSHSYNFPIRNDFIRVLGVALGYESDVTERENWVAKTNSSIEVLKKWKGRRLSYKGKALVINSLFLSRFVYLSSVLPVPKWVITTVKQSIRDFFWNGRKALISFDVLTLPWERGGANICDLEMKRDALRIKLISRILKNNIDDRLKSLILYFLNHYKSMQLGTNIFKCVPDPASLKHIPVFFKELLLAWRKLSMGTISPPSDFHEILQQPIFDNPFITDSTGKSLYNKHFIEAGIILVGDIMYELYSNHVPYVTVYNTIQAVNPRSRITMNEVGDYILHMIDAIPAPWFATVQANRDSISSSETEKIEIQLVIDDDIVDASGISARLATVLLRKMMDITPKGETHWRSLKPSISFDNRWSCVYGGMKDNLNADLDFKIMHNVMFTGDKLFRFKMSSTSLCILCNDEPESIEHLFCYCHCINNLWNHLIRKCAIIINDNSFSGWEDVTLFGLDESNNCKKKLIDFIFNTYKVCIWRTRARSLDSKQIVNISKYFHNYMQENIEKWYNFFSYKESRFEFWEIFSQDDVVLSFDPDENYVYNFDA